MINKNLHSGFVPALCKHDMVRPILKIPNLDTTDLSNFQLISNLPFTVKILEKTVLLQLQSFLDMSSILDKFQSSFRTNHGPESALLRVLNEILLSVDSEDSVILMLLDYIFTY